MLKVSLKSLITSLTFAISAPVFAQDAAPSKPAALTFPAWRDQQVLEAQNQVLRSSAHLNQIRSGKPSSSSSKDSSAKLQSSRLKKTAESETLAGAERGLKRAQESLEASNSLKFDNYINIYLLSLQDQPDAVAWLTEQFTKEELAEITRALIKRGTKISNAGHNGGVSPLESLSAAARPYAP